MPHGSYQTNFVEFQCLVPRELFKTSKRKKRPWSLVSVYEGTFLWGPCLVCHLVCLFFSISWGRCCTDLSVIPQWSLTKENKARNKEIILRQFEGILQNRKWDFVQFRMVPVMLGTLLRKHFPPIRTDPLFVKCVIVSSRFMLAPLLWEQISVCLYFWLVRPKVVCFGRQFS